MRLLRSVSDSVLQPLHRVVTANKIYIERCGAFKFCYVDGFGSAKAGVITKLIDSSSPHFYRISGLVLLHHATVSNTGDLFRH